MAEAHDESSAFQVCAVHAAVYTPSPWKAQGNCQSKSEMRLEGDQFGGHLNPADIQCLPISLSLSVTILSCVLLSSGMKKIT